MHAARTNHVGMVELVSKSVTGWHVVLSFLSAPVAWFPNFYYDLQQH